MDELQKKMDALLVKTGHVLQLFTSNSKNLSVKKERAFQIMTKENMIKVSEFLLGKEHNEVLFYWEYIESLKHKIALNLRALFLVLDFTTVKKTDFYDLLPIMKEFLKGTQKDETDLKALVPRGLKTYLMNLENAPFVHFRPQKLIWAGICW